MTTNGHENHNGDPVDALFEELRAANPYRDAGGTPEPITSPDARFEEITMQTIERPRSVIRPEPRATRPPWWQRPLTVAPAGLALAALLAVGALVVNAITPPAAAALVNEAAQRSAAFESGRVQTFLTAGDPADGAAQSLAIEHRYDGDDFILTVEVPETDGGFGDLEIRRVDGTDYVSIPPITEDGTFTTSDVEEDAWVGLGFTVNPETAGPEAVTAVLDRAEQVVEVPGQGSGTTYRATLPSTVLAEIGVESLPPGLAFLAIAPEALPETLTITATVNDEILTRLEVTAVGESPAAGFTDTTVVTVFSELGQPQTIEAPSADRLADADTQIGLPEGGDEAAAVLDELYERRPELCSDQLTALDDPALDLELLRAQGDAYIQCLEDAGEPAAAEAFRTLFDLDA